MKSAVRTALVLLLSVLLAPPALSRMAVAEATRGDVCAIRQFEGSAFTVCEYRPGRDELRLALNGSGGSPLGGFRALARDLGPDSGRVLFAMNGGMYDRAQAPVGLLVQSGRQVHGADTAEGRGNFYLKPNGVFSVGPDGHVRVEETGAFLARGGPTQWATQSGPLLLQGGRMHPAVAPDGASLAIRNGVGLRTPNQAYFVISNQPVSFGRLARFFRDGLGCGDALYLDGAVSSLWAPSLGRRDGRTGLGPLIVILAAQP